jgi:hypothetical protein
VGVGTGLRAGVERGAQRARLLPSSDFFFDNPGFSLAHRGPSRWRRRISATTREVQESIVEGNRNNRRLQHRCKTWQPDCDVQPASIGITRHACGIGAAPVIQYAILRSLMVQQQETIGTDQMPHHYTTGQPARYDDVSVACRRGAATAALPPTHPIALWWRCLAIAHFQCRALCPPPTSRLGSFLISRRSTMIRIVC